MPTYVTHGEDEVSAHQLDEQYTEKQFVVLLYGCKTSQLRVVDTRKLVVFDHKFLRNVASICWDHRVGNIEVRRRVLNDDGKSAEEVVDLH